MINTFNNQKRMNGRTRPFKELCRIRECTRAPYITATIFTSSVARVSTQICIFSTQVCYFLFFKIIVIAIKILKYLPNYGTNKVTLEWRSVESPNCMRRRYLHSACLLPPSYIFIHGGRYDNYRGDLDSCWLFDIGLCRSIILIL